MSLAACGDVTTGSTGTTGASVTSEFEIKYGEYHEYEVIDMGAGGSVEFDIWIPENGRSTDWGRAAIVELYENDYRGARDGYAGLLPYKIKACDAKNCGREPRYSLPWEQWRKVKVTWTAKSISADIDGTVVGVDFKGGGFGSPPVKMVYGSKPGGTTLNNAKMKNIKVTGVKKIH